MFVIKTRTLRSFAGFEPLCKLFVNVCYDDQMPVKEISGESDEFPLQRIFEMINNEDWTVPIAISKQRTTRDKNGVESIVFDAVVNSRYTNWTMASGEWKNVLTFLICNELEQERPDLLDRDQLKFPKRLSIDDPLEFDVETSDSEAPAFNGCLQPTDLVEPLENLVEELVITQMPGETVNTEDVELHASSNSFIVPKETKKVSGSSSNPLIAEMKTLDAEDTVEGFTHLMTITAKTAVKFDVKYHHKENQLVINSMLTCPLATKITQFTSFRVINKNTLYIYIK